MKSVIQLYRKFVYICIGLYFFPRGKNKQTNKQTRVYILEGVESEGLGASEVGMSP